MSAFCKVPADYQEEVTLVCRGPPTQRHGDHRLYKRAHHGLRRPDTTTIASLKSDAFGARWWDAAHYPQSTTLGLRVRKVWVMAH